MLLKLRPLEINEHPFGLERVQMLEWEQILKCSNKIQWNQKYKLYDSAHINAARLYILWAPFGFLDSEQGFPGP